MQCAGCGGDADSLKCSQCGARHHDDGRATFRADDDIVDAAIAADVESIDGPQGVAVSGDGAPETIRRERPAFLMMCGDEDGANVEEGSNQERQGASNGAS